MTSIFTADSSTQGTGGFTNTKAFNTKDDANIKFFSKSGIYNSSDNTIKIFTNNIDALTIDANQKVICNGSLITNLDYNNISLNKPTLATVATSGSYNDLSGTPNLSIYLTSATASSTYLTIANASSTYATSANLTTQLATKQDTLTSTTALVGNGASITNIAYANITGTPNLSGYATTTSLTTSSNNNYNYTSNSSNFLINYNNLINTPNLSTYATTTQLATKENALTFNSPLTRTTNAIGLSYDSSLNLNGTQLKVANPNLWNINGTNLSYSAGNVGIGITNSLRMLHLHAPTDVGVYLQMTNSLSGSGAGNGCFFGMDATVLNFVVGNTNNADIYFRINGVDRMRIKNTGYVGIENNSPIGLLCLGNSSVVNSDGNLVIGKCTAVGTSRQFKIGIDGSYNFCIGDYGANNTAGTWLNTQLCLNYSTGNVGVGVAPSATYKLNANGSINATTDFYRNGTLLHNYLFNNNGRNHETYTDFNSPTEFGYNYIMGTGNSPGVNGAGQYYSWSIGLGANYAYGSYQAQFALPRNVGNPYLCVRYREGGGWGGWNKINSGYADSAGGLTGTPNITVGTITTNNNAINAGSGGLTCGGITCTGDIVNQYWRLRNDSDWCRLYNNANTGYFNLAVQNFWMGGYIHSWLGVLIQPQCPCHINSSTYFGAVSGYMIYGANSVNASVSFSGYYVGLISEGAVWFKTWTLISSDERIKEEIEDINDDTALQMILTIQPKTYKYKDKIEKGDSKVYGFIAQQIKEVIPEAVKLNKEFIPNIYKIADLNNNQITLDFDVSHMMKVDDEISIITDKEGKKIYKIVDVNDNTFTIDKSLEGDKCLVYGTKIDDFHTLDKNYIFTLNVCATQELHRIIQKQQETINDLKQRLETLENKILSL